MSKEVRYISHREANAMRAHFHTLFPPDEAVQFQFGQVGCRGIDYFEVDDDDPRLQSSPASLHTERTE